MPKTVNQEYQDAAIRRQVAVRRYTAGQVAQVLRLMEKADAELTEKLRKHLAKLAGKPLDFKSLRMQAMLKDIRETRDQALAEYRALQSEQLAELGRVEAQAELAILNAVVPFEVAFAAADATRLRAIATARPFQGKLLKEWYQGLQQNDRGRIVQALQLGLAQGEPVDDIVRRVVGTRAAKYADGILATSRREAIAITRTAINHVSNHARELVWEQNGDIITALIWTSTLDGRTSASCRARDGHGSPLNGSELPEGIRPLVPINARAPGHINCRSTMVAYIDGVGLLGNRPSISDTRTRKEREVDFRKIARQEGKPIQQVRKEWAAKHIGPVPSTVNYQEWLSRQRPEFQDEVLGKAKAQLFRKGGLKLDEFVDRTGKELTLAQLAALDPAAFIRAGLDPDHFD